MIDEFRRSELGSRVAARKAAVASLQGRVVSPYLKKQLTRAQGFFNEVERRFLSNVEERTPAGEARWLDGAEAPFQLGVLKLHSVEKMVATYGLNARASSDPPRRFVPRA